MWGKCVCILHHHHHHHHHRQSNLSPSFILLVILAYIQETGSVNVTVKMAPGNQYNRYVYVCVRSLSICRHAIPSIINHAYMHTYIHSTFVEVTGRVGSDGIEEYTSYDLGDNFGKTSILHTLSSSLSYLHDCL